MDEVAIALGFDKSLVSRVERGLVKPSEDYVAKFCDVFFVDQQALVGGPLVLPVQIASE